MLDELLIEYVSDSENPDKNYKIGLEYERLGQTAAAISFFLRAAERTSNNVLSYECLLRIGRCFDRQKNRNYTVKSMYNAAIALIPDRPEAYYLMSKILETEGHYFESYTNVELGLRYADDMRENLDVGYPGKWGLVFQKAVSAWWRGRGMESRRLFQKLVNEHWKEMDESHQKSVESNVVNLGSGPEYYAFRMYDNSMYDKLRYKFPGSRGIENNYAQVYQDLFILSVLDGKKNGSFLEIGGAKPYLGNNTYLLEKEYGWKGVSLELNEEFVNEYKAARPTTVYCKDALQTDYDELISTHFDSDVIDYLQLDIEPARNTYECMLKIPFDKYKFRVITYEHDYYADVTRTYREKSREFLRSKGYLLVANDLSPDGICNFEDWWVHPDYVSKSLIDKMTDLTEGAKDTTAYMFCGSKEEIMGRVNVNFAKRAIIVDNFYENPDEVRAFAMTQEYIDGGLGRGFIGKRTHDQFLFPGLKETFEGLLNKKITKWQEHGMNGRFQLNISGEPVVYHCDEQTYAGMIYLTPDAPPETGTSTFRHKATKILHKENPAITSAFNYKTFLDKTPYETVDKFGNVYNRLVIFDAGNIHGASDYFGSDMQDGRLWHMFFFDAE